MATTDDIESYLLSSNLSYKNVAEDMWVVRTPGSHADIVVRIAGPLVLFRVKAFELEGIEDMQGLFQKLLELNANDMVHGNYGKAEDNIVLTAGLAIENLDYNEFQSTVEDLTMALENHYESLAGFRAAAS